MILICYKYVISTALLYLTCFAATAVRGKSDEQVRDYYGGNDRVEAEHDVVSHGLTVANKLA